MPMSSPKQSLLVLLIVPLVIIWATSARAQSAGLVAAYGFDAGTGTTAADASGNNNAGTLTAATWSASGRFGSALMFNGSSARVTVPSAASLNLTGAMTLEAWVRPTAQQSGWRAIVQKQ